MTYKDFAFAIPVDAKKAKIIAGDAIVQADLDEPTLRRLDWRSFMKVEGLRAYRITAPKTEDFQVDSVAELSYRWDIVYARPEDTIVVVQFQASPTRGNGEGQADALDVDQNDFRVDFGSQRGVAPQFAYPKFQGSDERGPYELDSLVAFPRGEDGSLQGVEFALAYSLCEPAERLTLTYRGDPIGEVAIEPEE